MIKKIFFVVLLCYCFLASFSVINVLAEESQQLSPDKYIKVAKTIQKKRLSDMVKKRGLSLHASSYFRKVEE